MEQRLVYTVSHRFQKQQRRIIVQTIWSSILRKQQLELVVIIRLTRTWTVEDDCNNVTTETQVTVLADTTAPVMEGVPEDITLYCGDDVPVAVDTSCTTTVENVALGKSATQINTGYGGVASRAE